MREYIVIHTGLFENTHWMYLKLKVSNEVNYKNK